MAENSDIATIEKWFRLLAEGDYDGMHALHTDDIVWEVITGDSEGIVPWLGRFEGRAGVDDCLRLFSGAVESERFETGEILTGADGAVVVLGSAEVRAIHNDARFRIEFAEFFRMREGKIAFVKVYGDSGAARAAFQDQQGEAGEIS